MGSTGDPPVPVGDPPTGTEPDSLFPNQQPSTQVRRDLLSGHRPDGGINPHSKPVPGGNPSLEPKAWKRKKAYVNHSTLTLTTGRTSAWHLSTGGAVPSPRGRKEIAHRFIGWVVGSRQNESHQGRKETCAGRNIPAWANPSPHSSFAPTGLRWVCSGGSQR
jgi:hypothetical protein